MAPARVAQSFGANVNDVSAARRFAMSAVAGWGLDPGDVGLVVTELAANALVHAESPFTVVVTHDENRLVVEVIDGGPGAPELTVTEGRRTSRMGMAIVDRLSNWGVRRQMQGGKAIWAEFDV